MSSVEKTQKQKKSNLFTVQTESLLVLKTQICVSDSRQAAGLRPGVCLMSSADDWR